MGLRVNPEPPEAAATPLQDALTQRQDSRIWLARRVFWNNRMGSHLLIKCLATTGSDLGQMTLSSDKGAGIFLISDVIREGQRGKGHRGSHFVRSQTSS